MSCCHNRVPRGMPPGIMGYVSRPYGEVDESLSAATTPGVGTFPMMVGAGVTIWAITSLLNKLISGRRG